MSSTKKAQLLFEHMERLEKVIETLEGVHDELTDMEADSNRKGYNEDVQMLKSISKDLYNNIIEDLNSLLYSRLDEFETYDKPSMDKEKILDVVEERY